MSLSSPPVITAPKLLAHARAATPGASFGAAAHGSVIVLYNRVDRVYDVGTRAQSHAQGRRGDVLPALEALLGAAS